MSETESSPIQIMSELMRIGLDFGALPNTSIEFDAKPGLVERLQSLPVGATWRDVFPHLPAHWLMEDAKTWTLPYIPLGPADYQTLPTGPAIHVAWPRAVSPEVLSALVAAAREASWPLHASWWIDRAEPDGPTRNAYVVLNHEASEKQLNGFLQWLTARSGVQLCDVFRTGAEAWAEDPLTA